VTCINFLLQIINMQQIGQGKKLEKIHLGIWYFLLIYSTSNWPHAYIKQDFL